MGKKLRYLLIYLCVEYQENSAFSNKFHIIPSIGCGQVNFGRKKVVRQHNIIHNWFIKISLLLNLPGVKYTK